MQNPQKFTWRASIGHSHKSTSLDKQYRFNQHQNTHNTYYKVIAVLKKLKSYITSSWPDSSVGIATGYGLDGPGIESRWWRDFSRLSRPVLGPTQSPVQWVPSPSRGWRAVWAWRWPLTPFQCRGQERVELYLYSLCGPTACTEPQCLYKGALCLFFFTSLHFTSLHFTSLQSLQFTGLETRSITGILLSLEQFWISSLCFQNYSKIRIWRWMSHSFVERERDREREREMEREN